MLELPPCCIVSIGIPGLPSIMGIDEGERANKYDDERGGCVVGWRIGRASRPIGKVQRLALAEQGFAKEAVSALAHLRQHQGNGVLIALPSRTGCQAFEVG